MSSPDDNERSDDFPNSDYAPKWKRDSYRQGSPDTAKGEPPSFLRRSLDPEIVHLPQRARSLDPETVDFPQPSPRRLGWLIAGGFIIAAALGAVIGLLATDELRSIFSKAPGSSTKTIELTSSSDNSKVPEQVSSPADRLPIAPTAPQAANEAPARLATVGGASEPAPTIRGVTDSEIRFGISAPFTGPAKELGQNMKLGIEAAFNAVNANGGVYGRQLRLVAADDGYEPTRTAATMKQLYERDQVFGLVGNVGTPTAVVALPYALDRKMLFFGAFTGAGLLRNDPPDRYVFNYRASYAEETAA